MVNRPSVSVVIPCFNAAHSIPLQLEALRRQRDAPPFEVLIVDNGSHDDLGSAVAPYCDISEYQLSVIPAHAHQGSSYARNVGIGAARAEVLMFCDADDAVSRTWVRNGLRSTHAADLWTGDVVMLPPEVFARGLDVTFSRFDLAPPEWTPLRSAPPAPLPVLLGGNFGAYRATLLELKGFDQAFAHFGDDNDLAFRAHHSGHPISVAPSVVVGVRSKSDLRTRLRIGFRASMARRHLLVVHHATALSPVPPWPIDLARCTVATALAPLRRGRVTAADLLLRWSHALGNAYGACAYRVGRKHSRTLLGEGLDEHGTAATDEGVQGGR